MSIERSPMGKGDQDIVRVLPIPVSSLAAIGLNDKLVDALTLGIPGRLVGLQFLTGLVPATTADKDIDLQAYIGAVPTTGGVLNLLTADCATKGAVKAATAITGANEFGATDTLTVECVEAAAVFAEGNGTLLVFWGEPAE